MIEAGTTPDPVEFYVALRGYRDVAACAASFKAVILQFGFDTYACGEIDLDNKELSVFHVIDWPDAWRKFYISSGLIDHDPIVEGMRSRDRPFTWSELRRDRALAAAGRQALQLCAENGWNEGLVVPVPRGGTRYGIVAMAGRSPDLSPEQRDLLSLVSECLLARIRMFGPQQRFPAPPAGLTPRELDVVRLVALGQSDGEIAAALGISPATAHQHVESARKRLFASSRAHMIGRAVALGIVDAA